MPYNKTKEKYKKYDLCVIGGGINGVGVALDAAGRGLKVLLLESQDLSGATTGSSSKLVHGGLRYLESFEFALVKESLAERKTLLRKAAHLVQPLEFIFPYKAERNTRPAWMIRLGLKMYDWFSGKDNLKKSRIIDLKSSPYDETLKPCKKAFAYFDAKVDDARLNILNALDAAKRGADIKVRAEFISAEQDFEKNLWDIQYRDHADQTYHVTAKAIVNAAGPWVGEVLSRIGSSKENIQANQLNHSNGHSNMRWVKGSHIIVPALYDGNHAYVLQHTDKRIVFVIPYACGQYSLIGTTDLEYEGDLREVKISDEEKHYLLDLVNHYFIQQVIEEDILWDYAGVRPLYDEGKTASASKVTREYHLDERYFKDETPVISIYGGKLTTYRALSEKVLSKLLDVFPKASSSWTESTPVLGGVMDQSLDGLLKYNSELYPWLEPHNLYRLTCAYGILLKDVYGEAASHEDLGIDFGCGLYQKEVDYLMNEEWAYDMHGILFLRSKLGLWLDSEEQVRLAVYVSSV